MSFWESIRDQVAKFLDCSRCMGMILAVVVIIVAAFKLPPEALARILDAGIDLAKALALVGVGAYARGKSIDAASAATTAASAPGTPDPATPGNG